MPRTLTRLAQLAALVVIAAVGAEVAPAQVPAGTAVFCSYKQGSAGGAPGLFLVPLDGGPVTPVTGLPPELAPSPTSAGGQGGYCVSIRSADGAVIVSTLSGVGSSTMGSVYLFVLHLNGAAVIPALTQQILLGAVAQAPDVARAIHCVLPDGRILVAAAATTGFLTSGPMAGNVLAIVDASTARFTLLPNPPITTGPPGGMAVDPTGKCFYWVQSNCLWGQCPSNARVNCYDLTTNQTCLIATLTGESAFGICCDDDGLVYVSSTAAATLMHSIYAIQPNGCNPATVTSVPSSLRLLASGLGLDRRSGRFVAMSYRMRPWVPAGFAGPQLNSLSVIEPVSGLARVVAAAPPGGWGEIGADGVAVSNAIESYGVSSSSSAGPDHYWFENFPNPGGEPVLGNAGFSLTVRAAPNAPVLSAVYLSFGRGSTNVFGLEILVDLNSTVSAFVPPGLSVPYVLPLPNVAALRGVRVRAQSLHLEANRLAASRGLEFDLL